MKQFVLAITWIVLGLCLAMLALIGAATAYGFACVFSPFKIQKLS
jgi:hypothetical protein